MRKVSNIFLLPSRVSGYCVLEPGHMGDVFLWGRGSVWLQIACGRFGKQRLGDLARPVMGGVAGDWEGRVEGGRPCWELGLLSQLLQTDQSGSEVHKNTARIWKRPCTRLPYSLAGALVDSAHWPKRMPLWSPDNGTAKKPVDSGGMCAHPCPLNAHVGWQHCHTSPSGSNEIHLPMSPLVPAMVSVRGQCVPWYPIVAFAGVFFVL